MPKNIYDNRGRKIGEIRDAGEEAAGLALFLMLLVPVFLIAFAGFAIYFTFEFGIIIGQALPCSRIFFLLFLPLAVVVTTRDGLKRHPPSDRDWQFWVGIVVVWILSLCLVASALVLLINPTYGSG